MKREHNFRFNIPLLNDPMSECYDLEVEREYRHIILGNMIHFMLNFNFFANFGVIQVHLNVWPNSPNFLISKYRSKTINIRSSKPNLHRFWCWNLQNRQKTVQISGCAWIMNIFINKCMKKDCSLSLHIFTGLGDVIIPGYFIAFCFFIDAVRRNEVSSSFEPSKTRYGITALIGLVKNCNKNKKSINYLSIIFVSHLFQS